MDGVILEGSALLLSLFCLIYSVTARKKLYFPLPKGCLAALKSQHFAYLLILCSVMVSAAASVAGTLGANGGAGAAALNFLHMAYYVTHNALSFFFALYILNISGSAKRQGGVFFVFFFLPLLLGELLILTNPITRLCFYIDENLIYHRGAAVWVLYAVGAAYTLAGFLYFIRFRGAVPQANRMATLILITVAAAGVTIQAVWAVPVELFFDAIAFLGFMALLERDPGSADGINGHFRVSVTIAIVLTFLAVIFMNVTLILNQTAAQSDKIGNIQLDVIRGDLQETITAAETDVLRVAIAAEQFMDSRPSMDEISRFFETRRDSLLSNDSFMNVYIAGGDWHVIPTFDAPPDYHAAERLWYLGAKENPGEVYITEPYKDARTGTMCFTVSTMLSDGETVVAMDLNFSKAQESIQRMTNGSDQTAMIITSGGLIAGYTDMSLVGERAEDRLPDYTDVIRRVASSHEHDSFRVRVGGQSRVVFSSETSNGWFLILSADTAALYADSYRQMIMMAAVNLLMLAAVLVFYVTGIRDRQRTADAMEEERHLIDALSDRLKKAAAKIVRLSDWNLIEETESPPETVLQIKESGLQLIEAMENLRSCSDLLRKPPEQEREKAGNDGGAIGAPSRKVRNGIIVTLLVSLALILALCVRSAVNLGDARMSRETDEFENQLNEWIIRQQSILYMFTDVISAQPDMLQDYEGTVCWLDDIAENYPEISACYIGNPYAEHPLIMNSGWVPDESFQLEARPWYRDTERSVTGFNISVPYMDAQTGYYCVTFSRVVYGDRNEFLGIFGIDFFLDKLIHVLGESYSSAGYAFLADSDRIIINHPNERYQMSQNVAVSVEDTEYAEAYNREGVTFLRDYSGRLMACLSRKTSSGFTVMVANRWGIIYGGALLLALAFLALFGFCIVIIVTLINRLIRWQEDVNRQLVEAAETAVSAGKAKSMFLAQMSHEIRTPINAVLGMNEMILNESAAPDILEYAANIQSAGRTLLSLINSILDFSKIEDGKMELVQTRYDTLGLIDDLANMISERAAKKGLELSLDISPDIPRALYGDDMRLRQIVTNLLTNAVKYTPSGSITLRMKPLRVGEETCELEIGVADTGIGIREGDIDKLFESFQRLDQERNRSIEGTGLGLAIVQRLLAMMDSKLEVRSVYGHGSTFSFRLTQRIVEREPIGIYENRPKAARPEEQRRVVYAPDANVLVVDDNGMNLKVAKGLLKRSGIVPDMADSGEKCLEMTARKRYDLIFLDHMMPGMDGLETLRALREREDLPESTAIVALTANAVAGAREEYLRAGFRDYLSKPIEVDELEQILARYLPEDKFRWLDAARPDSVTETGDALETLSAAGFRTEAGLRYAAGDRDFYLELLNGFAAEQEAKAGAIRDSFERRDFGNYEILVHALKSGARTIGADTLSGMALAQEEAAKNGDIRAVESGCAPLLERYREAAEAVRHALGGASGEAEASGEEITPEELRAMLEEALSCLESFEVERTGQLLKECRDSFFRGQPLRAPLSEAVAALEEFETDSAAETLRALLDAL
ncbi:MAG: response regulator [Oscillibacter sp.]|nr:response regulator [Oscillibacter sp.]